MPLRLTDDELVTLTAAMDEYSSKFDDGWELVDKLYEELRRRGI